MTKFKTLSKLKAFADNKSICLCQRNVMWETYKILKEEGNASFQDFRLFPQLFEKLGFRVVKTQDSVVNPSPKQALVFMCLQ